MKYDTSQKGLRALYPAWLAAIADKFLEKGTGFESTSGQAYEWLNTFPELRASRASVINGLNLLVEDGLLDCREEAGKGGYHGVYRAVVTRLEWNRHVHDVMVSHLLENFPPEIRAGPSTPFFSVLN